MSPHNKEITVTNQNFPQLCSHTFLPGIGECTDPVVSSAAGSCRRRVGTSGSVDTEIPSAPASCSRAPGTAETSTAPWCLGLGSWGGMTFYCSGFS